VSGQKKRGGQLETWEACVRRDIKLCNLQSVDPNNRDCGGAVYDTAVALVVVIDKLTYPLTGCWDNKPACRPDQVSIINGYVCMYVV